MPGQKAERPIFNSLVTAIGNGERAAHAAPIQRPTHREHQRLSGLSHGLHHTVISHDMVMTMAGVIHLGDHHLWCSLYRLTTAHLQSIGAVPLRSWWCEELLAADQTHRVLREAKGLLEVVFHHLVVMELEIGRHQIGAQHTHQQQALATGLRANQQAFAGVFNAEPLAGAQIEEVEFLGLRVKVLHPLLNAVLMGTQIDGV